MRPLSFRLLTLRLRLGHWSAVAEEIRSGSCKIETLRLIANRNRRHLAGNTSTDIIQAVATSLEHSTSLRTLKLFLWSGFSDGAVVALAKALTVNMNLCSLKLGLYCKVDKAWAQEQQFTLHVLGDEAYKAMSEMLKSKKEPLELHLPRPRSDASPEQWKLYRIESVLNAVGRGNLVATNQASNEAWVRAFDKVNSSLVAKGEEPEHHVGCVYSLLLAQAQFGISVASMLTCVV